MTICPNEHVHFLLLALRDQDRDAVLVLLAELLTSLVVPGNPLPQSPSSHVTDEGLRLADRLLRDGAARKRAPAVAVPSLGEGRGRPARRRAPGGAGPSGAAARGRQATALDQVADALDGVSHLATIVLVD